MNLLIYTLNFFKKKLYIYNFFKRKNIDPHQCMDEIAIFFFLKARGSPTNFYQPSWGKKYRERIT
jgi:hypothetical protein